MSDETTLLPCPFCGGEAHVTYHPEGAYSCGCNDSECNGYAPLGARYGKRKCVRHRSGGREAAIAAWNTRASDRHPYEQRITGDGSNWGEIMRGAYDDLMASACESCTPEQMEQLANHIRAELGSGTCENLAKHDALWFACSKCGAQAGNGTYSKEWMHQDHTDEECAEYNGEPFKYCPNCGCKVIGG